VTLCYSLGRTKGNGMEEKVMRFRIPVDIFKRYKVLLVKMDLSFPKQTTELIRKFVEVQEKNLESIKEEK